MKFIIIALVLLAAPVPVPSADVDCPPICINFGLKTICFDPPYCDPRSGTDN